MSTPVLTLELEEFFLHVLHHYIPECNRSLGGPVECHAFLYYHGKAGLPPYCDKQ
jgi:hypothetical protein